MTLTFMKVEREKERKREREKEREREREKGIEARPKLVNPLLADDFVMSFAYGQCLSRCY